MNNLKYLIIFTIMTCSSCNNSGQQIELTGYGFVLIKPPLLFYSSPDKSKMIELDIDKNSLPINIVLDQKNMKSKGCVSLMYKMTINAFNDKGRKFISPSIKNYSAVSINERNDFLSKLKSNALVSRSVCATD